MKIRTLISARSRSRAYAVLVLMMFLFTMILLVAATTQSAIWLRAEINLVEKRQIERLQHISIQGVAVPAQPQTPASIP